VQVTGQTCRLSRREVAAKSSTKNNAPRMRYHWFRQCGLFVGSGVVEASCKSVIGQRLKLSGMHWTVNGADAIIVLRVGVKPLEAGRRPSTGQRGNSRPLKGRESAPRPQPTVWVDLKV
jgi:hypothetical protein